MQKDTAKGRGLLTILILSFSYPYISLHIMTLVTKRIVETTPVPLSSAFLRAAHTVHAPSRPVPRCSTGAVGQPTSRAAHPRPCEEGVCRRALHPASEDGERAQHLQTLSFPTQLLGAGGCLPPPRGPPQPR